MNIFPAPRAESIRPDRALSLGRRACRLIFPLLVIPGLVLHEAVPKAAAGAAAAESHALSLTISGTSEAPNLTGVVSYDAATGALSTPVYDAAAPTAPDGWAWSWTNFADLTKPLDTPVLSWHTSTQTNGVWDSVVQLKAAGNVDPFLSYSFAAKNNTTANQTFSFSYGESIVPPVNGAYSIYADIAGSLTHAGITSTALLTPTLGDLDGDGIIEIQTLKLSTDGGVTFLNAGVDVGQAQSWALLGTTGFSTVSDTITGNLSSINYWQFDVSFTLTPGHDAAALSGFALITPIPEPTTYAVTIGAAALFGAWLRRRRLSAV